MLKYILTITKQSCMQLLINIILRCKDPSTYYVITLVSLLSRYTEVKTYLYHQAYNNESFGIIY